MQSGRPVSLHSSVPNYMISVAAVSMHCKASTAKDMSCPDVAVNNASWVQVLDNEICFKWSEYENIFELFHARSNMHRRVYTHR